MQNADNARHHVVFCADRNYLPYLGVTAYSLLANNGTPGLAITVITDEVDQQNRQRFDALSGSFGVPVTIYQVSAKDRQDLEGVDVQGRFTIANYFRLLIPRVLPATAQAALYLDADMIIDGDVSGLFGSDMAGKVLGVCPDPVGRRFSGKPGYFNSGLMLINLPHWRAQDIPGKVLAYAATRNDLKLCEQDALNAIVPGESILWLSLAYNYMIYDRLKTEYRHDLDIALGGISAPKILHYTGATKPWHAWFSAQQRDKYLDYLRRSPWHDVPGLLKMQATTAQQEFWLGEAAEAAGDFKKAAAHYKRVASGIFRQ